MDKQRLEVNGQSFATKGASPLLIAGALGTVALVSTTNQQPAEAAITVANVTDAMTLVTDGIDTTATAMLPIGAAILAFGAIGSIVYRFLGG